MASLTRSLLLLLMLAYSAMADPDPVPPPPPPPPLPRHLPPTNVVVLTQCHDNVVPDRVDRHHLRAITLMTDPGDQSRITVTVKACDRMASTLTATFSSVAIGRSDVHQPGPQDAVTYLPELDITTYMQPIAQAPRDKACYVITKTVPSPLKDSFSHKSWVAEIRDPSGAVSAKMCRKFMNPHPPPPRPPPPPPPP